MNFQLIDLEHWKRKATYDHYINHVPCTYSMCVNVNITALLSKIKDLDIKFFPTILYGISYVVNQHEEFRMNFNEYHQLGYYDVVHPCFTVFHEDTECFTNIWTRYSSSFEIFYENYLADMEKYKHSSSDKPMAAVNLFNVSSIPWTSFTGFNLNLQKGYDYLPPIFTIGKFFEQDERVLLPLAIQINHAVCDGFHAARFVNELQEWLDNFSK